MVIFNVIGGGNNFCMKVKFIITKCRTDIRRPGTAF